MKSYNFYQRFIAVHALSLAVLVILFFIFAGAIVFHLVEWWSYFDSIYYTVVTVTTIWYGDFTPITTLGKIFTMIYAMTWVPIFIVLAWFMLENRFNRRIKRYLFNVHREIQNTEHKVEEIEEEIHHKDNKSTKKSFRKRLFTRK